MLPIDQLVRPLSKEEVEASILALMEAADLPVKSWQKGGVARTIVAVVATVFAGYTKIIALIARAGFLDYSEGVWLTLLAFYTYGVRRPEATYGTGPFVLNNAGGGLYTFDPGDLIVRNPATNKTYTNTETVHLAPFETNKTITIRAQEAGSGSTAAPGQINDFVTKYLGVTGSNPVAIIGQDAMSDPELRELCRQSLGALSPNGPAAAYEYIAKTSRRADGTPVGVTRVYIPPAPGDNTVTVYVASATGEVPGDKNDATTDLGIVNHRIQRLVVPLGVTAFVKSAVPKPISVTCDVYVSPQANISVGQWQSDIEFAIRSYIARVPVGGFILPSGPSRRLPWRAIVGAIEAASPSVIEAKLGAELDIPLAENEVAVIAAPVINIHYV